MQAQLLHTAQLSDPSPALELHIGCVANGSAAQRQRSSNRGQLRAARLSAARWRCALADNLSDNLLNMSGNQLLLPIASASLGQPRPADRADLFTHCWPPGAHGRSSDGGSQTRALPSRAGAEEGPGRVLALLSSAADIPVALS